MTRSILITGSNGQLGSELKLIGKNYPGLRFIFTDIEQLDITKPEEAREYILSLAPEWIINCAGYTNVDGAESDPERAYALNGASISLLTECLAQYGGKLIHLSSDFVYDGTSKIPYREDDQTNPISVYGKSKLAGDNIALSYPNAMVIRTSWLYSQFGHNFVKTILKLSSQNKQIGVVNDQTGTPTYALDLARVILAIISASVAGKKNKPGLYNYSNEGSCTWYEFALAVRDMIGSELKINPITTDQYPLPAKRPEYSVLDKSKIKSEYGLIIPNWRISLDSCIKILKDQI